MKWKSQRTSWSSLAISCQELPEHNVCKHLKSLLLEQQAVINPHDVYTQIMSTAAKHGLCQLLKALVEDAKLHNVFDHSDLIAILQVAVGSAQEECVSYLAHLLRTINIGNLMELLVCAAQSGHYSIFLQLENEWPDRFKELIQSHLGTKLMSEACSAKAVDIVKNLLVSGVNINASGGSNFDHPLACSKCVHVTELLLQYGANMSKQSGFDPKFTVGDRALREAVIIQAPEIIEMLVKYGARVDCNLLIFAYNNSKLVSNTDIPYFILNTINNIDLNKCDRTGSTVLIEAIQRRDQRFVQNLIEKGADVNTLDVNRNSPLIMAAIVDDVRIITLLLQNGAKVDHVNLDERNALMVAAKANSLSAFRAIIDAGADVNFQRYNHTLLSMLLCQYDDESKIEFIKYLLMNKATVSPSERKKCLTKVHHCIAEQEHDLMYTLINIGGFPPTLLKQSSRFCMIKQHLLDEYKNVFSPLCMALLCGSVTVAQEMLKNHYLTSSDLTLLPKNRALREHLKNKECVQSLALLEELSSSPPSLLQLTFICVSDQAGSVFCREPQLKSSGLPGGLLNALLFKSWDFGRVASSETSNKELFVWEMADRYKFEPLITHWPSYYTMIPGPLF